MKSDAVELGEAAAEGAPLTANDVNDSPGGAGTGPAQPAAHDPRPNVHRAIVEFHSYGSVVARGASVTEAMLEIRELEEGLARFDVARALVRAYRRRYRNSPRLLRAEKFLAGPGTGRAGEWRDDRGRDVQIVSQPGATTTVIVFCGLTHRFGVPLDLLWHVWLSAYPVNMIVVRDKNHVVYMWGIASLGSFDDSIAELGRISRSLGAERIVTMGNSSGGSGALAYGPRLGAERCIAFSPVLQAWRTVYNETPTRPAARLVSLREEGRVEWPDARSFLSGSPMQADVYYSPTISRDRKQAELLKGLANVTLNPVDDVPAHTEVPVVMIQQGVFQGALDAALGPPGAPAHRDDLVAAS